MGIKGVENNKSQVENMGEPPPEDTNDETFINEIEVVAETEAFMETELNIETSKETEIIKESELETEKVKEILKETEFIKETEIIKEIDVIEKENDKKMETENEAESMMETEDEINDETQEETEFPFSDTLVEPFVPEEQPTARFRSSYLNTNTAALGIPEHYKTIERTDDITALENAGDNHYRLSLDVKGNVGESIPIDVLLIVDKSDSINNTLKNNINSAIKILYQELRKAEGNINISVVEFSGPKEWNSGLDNPDANVALDWRSIKGGNEYQLGNRSGGTNWQAGVRVGESQFEKRPMDNNRYTIFLTDGLPIAFYSDNNPYNPYHTLWDKDYGNGTSYNKAVAEWGNSAYLKSSMAYVVDATAGNTKHETCLAFAEAISGNRNNCLKGNNSATLTDSFKKIADSIIKPMYTNVYIQDSLSEYADFDYENLDLKVFAGETELSEDKYKMTLTEESKTIRIDLLNGKPIEKDMIYKIQYNIVPSQLAYSEYQTKGIYNAIGDTGTDSPGNSTSSGKSGFRCNAIAVIGYDVNEYKNNTAIYAHPVIQVSNLPDSPLPECGGEGNRVYEVMGILMIFMASLLFIEHRIKFV